MVKFRGLTLDGDGTATYGIEVKSVGSMTISNCSLQNFQANGIYIGPGTITVSTLNSVMTNNGSAIR